MVFKDTVAQEKEKEITSARAKFIQPVNPEWQSINLNGLGNTYANKLSTDTNKLAINEDIIKTIENDSYYLDENLNVFVILKEKKILTENTVIEKKVVSEEITKMKHLLGYNPGNFTKTDDVKTKRGF